ncbi:MAG: Nif3-like dinuclear metal center hexameric protein [Ferruginibacter sp.]|nr:Nif3-like dinuclear metal center hexameric protein [Ferruginibacter sp.]
MNSLPDNSRKKFILDSLKIAGGAVLLSAPEFARTQPHNLSSGEYTVKDIIDIILKQLSGAPFKDTVDTLKSGSPDNKVTGIITTMFATIDVIKTAVKNNVNFIIAHEPTFYNHTDDVSWVKPNDIVQQKLELLQKNNITVWRFHDYCHAIKPDAISYGVAKKAGWLAYFKKDEIIIKIPSISFEKLIQQLKTSLDIAHVKVIGNLTQHCERIALLPGAAGGQTQIKTVQQEKPDVLIVGEVNEWETAEYIRDARLLGSKTSLIILGHCVSEEPGMEWVVDWLKPLCPHVKIMHIASEDPFKWM